MRTFTDPSTGRGRRQIAHFHWETDLVMTPFVLFALGDYLSGSLLTGLIQLKTSLSGVITEAILAIFFGLCIFVILRPSRSLL